jgi:16S rRNA (uracil1498-N3)-methyltransferase
MQGQEHLHLSNVLRCSVGEEVVLWCGDGLDYYATIQSIQKQCTLLQVTSVQPNTAELDKDIVLYLGLIKNIDRFELAVQKCIELGVYKIVPFVSQYATFRKINLDRLNAIALNAIKQCGRSRLVEISSIKTWDEVLIDIQSDPAIFAYEKAVAPIKLALQSQKIAKAKTINVVIGSEGGFSAEEIMQVYDISITPVSLGKRILRAETAAIAVMSVLTIV